jgi:hypothetical protein
MMGRAAARVRMTEGQLYTAVLAVLVALLLSLTGLPTAERVPTNGTDTPTLTPAEGSP